MTTVKPVKADIPNADWHGGANPSTKPIEAVTATPVRAKSKIWRQGKVVDPLFWRKLWSIPESGNVLLKFQHLPQKGPP